MNALQSIKEQCYMNKLLIKFMFHIQIYDESDRFRQTYCHLNESLLKPPQHY